MGRLRALIEAAGKMLDGYFWIMGKTIWLAVYGPVIVLGLALIFGAIPYYFITLCTSPSLIHLYLAVVFAGVAGYRLFFWKATSRDFEVRRGRRVERSKQQPPARVDTKGRSRSASSRIERNRTSINRGR